MELIDWLTSTVEQRQEYRLWVLEQLRARVVTVNFTKADGTNRTMNCTLLADYLPDTSYDNNEIDESESNASLETVAVWDTDISAWRSFRFDRLTNVQ
jgi:hypothetical protein